MSLSFAKKQIKDLNCDILPPSYMPAEDIASVAPAVKEELTELPPQDHVDEEVVADYIVML